MARTVPGLIYTKRELFSELSFCYFFQKNELACAYHSQNRIGLRLSFEPLVGFEPTTPRLQITCSGQLS